MDMKLNKEKFVVFIATLPDKTRRRYRVQSNAPYWERMALTNAMYEADCKKIKADLAVQ